MWRWAHQQAALYNANTRLDLQGVLWTAEDFLGKGDRAKRLVEAQVKAEQAKKDKADEDFLNLRLAQIERNPGSKKAIPFWAMADWDGKIPEGETKWPMIPTA